MSYVYIYNIKKYIILVWFGSGLSDRRIVSSFTSNSTGHSQCPNLSQVSGFIVYFRWIFLFHFGSVLDCPTGE